MQCCTLVYLLVFVLHWLPNSRPVDLNKAQMENIKHVPRLAVMINSLFLTIFINNSRFPKKPCQLPETSWFLDFWQGEQEYAVVLHISFMKLWMIVIVKWQRRTTEHCWGTINNEMNTETGEKERCLENHITQCFRHSTVPLIHCFYSMNQYPIWAWLLIREIMSLSHVNQLLQTLLTNSERHARKAY